MKIAQNPLNSGGSLLPGGECWRGLDRRAAKRRLGRQLLMYHPLPEGSKGWRTGCRGILLYASPVRRSPQDAGWWEAKD